MKTNIRYTLSALVLCMGAFFTPVTASAAGGTDTTPPRISAESADGMLHIEATDDDSGVEAIYIAGKRVNYRVDGALDLDFEDFAPDGQETVEVYAIDFAGNQSEAVTVTNPHYQAPEPEPEQKPITPDGQASVLDNATDEEGKEFFTFVTPEENIFYLVIDRQRDSDNVYFLNAVTENDLADLAEKSKEGNGGESAMPVVEVCSCVKQCEAGKVDTACSVCKNDLKACTGEPEETKDEKEKEPEKPEKGGSAGIMIFILLAVLAFGGAGYYLKIYKPKHDLDDAEDLDDLLDEDEPEINEDAEMQAQAGMEVAEPDMDAAFYDDYPDDDMDSGPEQEE
ncbi:DUF4366 domain-containing protein [Blautia sp.]|uniref:DUF4366 domain-containing protein n=1 Tax=Blautia sp. TaxID=1955243 RepID=UPI00258326CC|nr:DUF4366 domain-containing protein [Blautia sp.]